MIDQPVQPSPLIANIISGIASALVVILGILAKQRFARNKDRHNLQALSITDRGQQIQDYRHDIERLEIRLKELDAQVETERENRYLVLEKYLRVQGQNEVNVRLLEERQQVIESLRGENDVLKRRLERYEHTNEQ